MFRVPKHKRYEYKPRYYDAEKAEMDKRFKFVESEAKREREAEKAGLSADGQSFNFRSDFESRRLKRESNKRLLVIVVLLLAITYLILWYPVSSDSSADTTNATEIEAPAILHDLFD